MRIVWRYTPDPQRLPEFLATYASDGVWAELFRQADGYLGTELRSLADGTYRTIDRWRSPDDYRHFRARFAPVYALLDEACAALTLDKRQETT
ncbi:hypothetical protein [Solimonas soli]|uniref:hypothetical protein n=1 Tax=Solimonas soli TaxID=413479 RepID=UPI0004B11D1A|nr:hypothetical protein [Solimonas soli]